MSSWSRMHAATRARSRPYSPARMARGCPISVPLPVVLTIQSRWPCRQAEAIIRSSTATPAPYLVPGGLFFTSLAGATTAPPGQQVQVNTSSATAETFNASASTADGGTWLGVTPTTGTVSGQTAG